MTVERGHRRQTRSLRPLWLLGLMALAGLPCLVGCSSDDPDEAVAEKSFPIEFMGVTTQYDEAVESGRGVESARAGDASMSAAAVSQGVTRAWVPPSGFSLMSPQEQEQTIGVFLTKDGEEPMKGILNKGREKWRTTLDMANVTANTTYYLYGYVPHISGVSCTIAPNGTYSEGAVLNILNLPAVTGSDVSVVVGARNGYQNGYTTTDVDYSITGLRRGDFAYTAQATGTSDSPSNNYVFLLFDHLYASFSVRMKVDDDYNALRTIKLKELRLQTSAGNTVTKKRLNATVTLSATASAATDPISSIVFTPVGDDDGDGTMFSPAEPLTLTTSFSEYIGYFMPTGVDKLSLTSIYDVYDKKGNLTREGCMATNTILISQYDRQTVALRGTRYNVSMIIQPTYLYVLSDPDLDNPTVVVN